MSKSLLSLLPAGLAVDQVVVAHDRVAVIVRARATTAACPVCRRLSRRVHSRYVRRLGDLPWQGRGGHATEQRFVGALIAGSSELAKIIGLARAFSTMLCRQQADRLDSWLATAKGTALAGFANAMTRDLTAIRAALSLPWSTGPVEGQISHLKTIKRSMCGGAKFDLLRHRVLEAA